MAIGSPRHRTLWITMLLAPTLGAAICGRSQETRLQDRPEAKGPQAIYSTYPNDPWNRIFFMLFSGDVTFRYSNEFSQAGPLSPLPELIRSSAPQSLRVGSGIFKRFESGDRAIDPLYRLYPSDSADDRPNFGVSRVEVDPAYHALLGALQEASDEGTERTPLARAIMQNDLWSTFDIIYGVHGQPQQLAEHKRALLEALARMIAKTALTSAEIACLPNNYSRAAGSLGAPDIFDPTSGWMEVQWGLGRSHNREAGYRRVARVFVKPSGTVADKQAFLDSLRSTGSLRSTLGTTGRSLEGVALVTQLLLINAKGEIKPSRVTTDVQIRMIEKNRSGALSKTAMREFEFSRRQTLLQPSSDGFVSEGEDFPAYLPNGGEDLGFATPQIGGFSPILVKLRTRCASCHGSDLGDVITFQGHVYPPEVSATHVKQFDPAAHEAADFVISKKVGSDDWKALRYGYIR